MVIDAQSSPQNIVVDTLRQEMQREFHRSVTIEKVRPVMLLVMYKVLILVRRFLCDIFAISLYLKDRRQQHVVPHGGGVISPVITIHTSSEEQLIAKPEPITSEAIYYPNNDCQKPVSERKILLYMGGSGCDLTNCNGSIAQMIHDTKVMEDERPDLYFATAPRRHHLISKRVCVENVATTIAKLKSKGYKTSNMTLLGHSLGAAAILAALNKPELCENDEKFHAVILEKGLGNIATAIAWICAKYLRVRGLLFKYVERFSAFLAKAGMFHWHVEEKAQALPAENVYVFQSNKDEIIHPDAGIAGCSNAGDGTKIYQIDNCGAARVEMPDHSMVLVACSPDHVDRPEPEFCEYLFNKIGKCTLIDGSEIPLSELTENERKPDSLLCHVHSFYSFCASVAAAC